MRGEVSPLRRTSLRRTPKRAQTPPVTPAFILRKKIIFQKVEEQVFYCIFIKFYAQ